VRHSSPLLHRSRQRPGRLQNLTARERELLALMSQGYTNAAIAEGLTLSPKTVESHVRSIFSKLEVDADGHGHRRVRAVLTYLAARDAGDTAIRDVDAYPIN
jgi:DNA-binding NarL/FixJ family response regulator